MWRRSELRAGIRPRPLRAWIASGVGLAAIAAVAWMVAMSPLFRLRTLTVSGTRHLTHADVARLGGIGPRTNVLRLSPASLEDRIEREPWVRSVQISRSLPGTLSIVVSERQAAARTSTGWIVSADGVVLGRAASTSTLPLIWTTERLQAGQVVRSERAPGLLVAAGLTFGLRGRVARIDVDARGAVTLLLRDGTRVIYGDASSLAAKARALAGVLRWARAHGVEGGLVDVSAPSAPALRPATP